MWNGSWFLWRKNWGFFLWDLAVVNISPEWVTGPEQGKSSGRIATFSLWTGMFRRVKNNTAGYNMWTEMPRNRLPRVMKYYSPTGRRNHGRPLKRLLDTWDLNGSTSGPIPWKIYYYDDDYDDDDDKLGSKDKLTSYTYLRQTVFPQDAEERADNLHTTETVFSERYDKMPKNELTIYTLKLRKTVCSLRFTTRCRRKPWRSTHNNRDRL